MMIPMRINRCIHQLSLLFQNSGNKSEALLKYVYTLLCKLIPNLRMSIVLYVWYYGRYLLHCVVYTVQSLQIFDLLALIHEVLEIYM